MNEIRKITRYHTKHLNVAFNCATEKNKVRGKNVWRVASKVKNRIIFDIDNFDIDNASMVKDYYEALLKIKFKVIKTYSGYHFISEKYDNELQWQYDTCRVLYPFLEKENLQKYIEKVHEFGTEVLKRQKVMGFDRREFLIDVAKQFRKSGLYCGIGEFDMLFAINVIWKGYYCLRISKKSDTDKPEQITI